MHTGAGHDFDQMYLESLREQIADLSAERDALSEEQRMWQDRIQRLVVANTALAERVRRYEAFVAADDALVAKIKAEGCCYFDEALTKELARAAIAAPEDA